MGFEGAIPRLGGLGPRGREANRAHEAVTPVAVRFSSFSSLDWACPIFHFAALRPGPPLREAVTPVAVRFWSFSSLDWACPIFQFGPPGASNLERPRGRQLPVKRMMLERSPERRAALAPRLKDAWGLKDRFVPAGAADCFMTCAQAIRSVGAIARLFERTTERS